jgi:hypothetical protein
MLEKRRNIVAATKVKTFGSYSNPHTCPVLLGQSMPIATVQDANSIRGMSRCTRYKFDVTNICKRLVVDGSFNNGSRWRTGHVWSEFRYCKTELHRMQTSVINVEVL